MRDSSGHASSIKLGKRKATLKIVFSGLKLDFIILPETIGKEEEGQTRASLKRERKENVLINLVRGSKKVKQFSFQIVN